MDRSPPWICSYEHTNHATPGRFLLKRIDEEARLSPQWQLRSGRIQQHMDEFVCGLCGCSCVHEFKVRWNRVAHVAAQCLAMKVGPVFGHESWLDQWYLSPRVRAGMCLRTQDTDKTRPVCVQVCVYEHKTRQDQSAILRNYMRSRMERRARIGFKKWHST